MAILPLAKTMLLAAYTRQFAGSEPRAWQEWAEACGYDRAEAKRAQEDLRSRNLVSPAGGGRLWVTTVGAELVERGVLADPGLVGSQFVIRRRILRALEERRAEVEKGAPGAAAGLTIDQIAARVGEVVAHVVPALSVLKDRFLLQKDADDSQTLRISQAGRSALPAVRQAWPLSTDLEGTGNRRPIRW
jgi:hypothetical protein